MVFGLVLLVFGFIMRLKFSGCAFGFILFSVLFFFFLRLWLLVLLWLKFSGYGFGVLFFVFFVRRWSLVFSLAEMFRLWFLVLFSIFLVLFPLLCQAVLVFVRLWSLVLFSIFLVLLFVGLWSLFWSCFCLIFGYGYAVAEALRLWSLVLFLLSLLGGVVALLRTRLLFVYFFLFRLLSVSSIFSCGVFLACAFCLCQVVRVELPVFFSFGRSLL